MARNGKTASGATGGPATGRGLNYQANYAMLQALDLIFCLLTSEPLARASITLEPRKIERGAVTCWDIHVSQPDTVIEAKLNPTRKDILEWLDRVGIGATQSNSRKFHLLYSRGAPPLLASIERLCRIAQEANHSPVLFSDLVKIENVCDKEELLNRFGANPERVLIRIKLVPVDEGNLENEIQLRLKFLAEPNYRQPLYNFLFSKFSAAIATRSTFQISELMHEAEQCGVAFRRPSQVEPSDLDPVVHASIFILQSCSAGLPPQLLAEATGTDRQHLEVVSAQYLERGDLTQEGGLWFLNPLQNRIAHKEGQQLLGRALGCLLEFIKANRNNKLGRQQAANAISLAKAAESGTPNAVARIFIALDKVLKRTGNKRLVLEAAALAVRAAGRSSHTRLEVEGEVQARICGLSWVFQRIGRLDEAMTEANKSLRDGKAIGWDRNTAFCYKCIGRLCRMQAERAREVGDEAGFKEKIRESIESLNQAIDWFSGMTTDGPDKFGPDSAEVGDCFSLLGRTYFAARQFGKAEEMLEKARQRIRDQDSKDYMDMRILFGDLSAEHRNPDQAILHYSEALKAVGEDDAERSEIAARAFFRRGLCKKRFNRSGAMNDLKKATEVWLTLDEQLAAAESEWHALLLNNEIPSRHRPILETLSPPVRVESVRLYREKLASLPKGARAQRKELSDGYVKELIRQAIENCALKTREW